jgi:Putative Ig domain
MRMENFKKNIFLIVALFFFTTGTASVALAAKQLNITPNNIPNGVVSDPYSVTLSVAPQSNGKTPYTWSITSGSLPPGFSLTPNRSQPNTADIWGTPFLSGTYNFTVGVTDSAGGSGSQSYKVTIVPPCSFFDTNIGSISFGIIDPSAVPGPALGTITQQINFVCKNNMTYTVTASPASGWTINQGGFTIPYTIGFNTTGVGGGANVPIPLLTASPAPQIPQPNYANAAGGVYANNQAVTFTISWTQAGGGSIIASLPVGNVSGVILSTCLVSQSPGVLTFNINPSASSTTTTLSPDLQIKCTMNGTFSISTTSACGGQMYSSYPPSCSGYGIPYLFTCLGSTSGCSGSALGTGFGGGGISLGIGGSAVSAGYANAPAGNYGDLRTITISY